MGKNRGFNTIRWRMMFGYVLLTLIGFGVVFLLTTQVIRNYLINQRVREMQNSMNMITNAVAYDFSQQNSEALHAASVRYAIQYGGHMLILDHNGVTQVDSSSVFNGRRLTNRSVAEVLWNGKLQDEMMISYLPETTEESEEPLKPMQWLAKQFSRRKSTVYYVQAIRQDDKTIGAVLFSADIQDVLDRVGELSGQITIIMLAVLLAAAFLSILLTGSLTKPIVELTQVIRRMSRGELNQRVKISGTKELMDLGKTFNDMSERIEQTDRVRSDFISSASHEIKTPLATMKILVESLLYQETMDEGMTREFLGDIDKEINRLNAVITDLLRLVQADKSGEDVQADFETIDLKDVCKDTIERLVPIAQKRNIQVIANLKSTRMRGNAVKLEQAVFNLVDNAIKYTNDGGKVSVFCKTEGRECVLRIQDTGIGIPKEDLNKIFERFYRVDKARARSTGGTGLGLAIVERMIKIHEGSIEVESEENQGTTFTIRFPAA